MILESLRKLDFENVLSKHVSINEYTSDLITNSVVVVLYFLQQEPCKDYDMFIQTSDVKYLETRYDSFPSVKQEYLFYVSFNRDKELGKNITRMFEDLDMLANNVYYDLHIVNDTTEKMNVYKKTKIEKIEAIINSNIKT